MSTLPPLPAEAETEEVKPAPVRPRGRAAARLLPPTRLTGPIPWVIAILIAFPQLALWLPASTWAAPSGVSARAWVVIDQTSGRELAAYQADLPLAPASRQRVASVMTRMESRPRSANPAWSSSCGSSR